MRFFSSKGNTRPWPFQSNHPKANMGITVVPCHDTCKVFSASLRHIVESGCVEKPADQIVEHCQKVEIIIVPGFVVGQIRKTTGLAPSL